jgi:hypothetical protein
MRRLVSDRFDIGRPGWSGPLVRAARFWLGLCGLCLALGWGLLPAGSAQGRTQGPPLAPAWSGQSPAALQLVDVGGAQTLGRVMARFAAGEGVRAEPQDMARLGGGCTGWPSSCRPWMRRGRWC